MNKSKKQLIFTRINELFAKIVETRNSLAFAKFLRFIRKFSNRSPFNNALVFAQNPDCFYWATEREWEKMGRKVKENARPMVVLFPFGPVEFVYDYKDTEGKEITEERLIYWWITNSIYDKFYTEFRSKIDEIDEKLANFQKAEDNYFITVNYLLELANRSYELFLRSKLEEKRLLIKLTLSNLKAEGKTLRYNLLKPFNYLFEYSSCLSGLPLINRIRTCYLY